MGKPVLSISQGNLTINLQYLQNPSVAYAHPASLLNSPVPNAGVAYAPSPNPYGVTMATPAKVIPDNRQLHSAPMPNAYQTPVAQQVMDRGQNNYNSSSIGSAPYNSSYPMQPTPQSSRMMVVTVPPGMYPGQVLSVNSPLNQLVQVNQLLSLFMVTI